VLGRIDAARQQAPEQSGTGLQERKENRCDEDIEQGVKIGEGAGIVLLERDHETPDRMKHRKSDRHADNAIEQIPTGSRLTAGSSPARPSKTD
jgi:hypothetical protein